MKIVYLKPIKVVETVEKQDKQDKQIDDYLESDPFAEWEKESKAKNDDNGEYNGFSDDLYDDNTEEQIKHKNTDGLKEYRVDSNNIYTLKSARMSKEIRTPFAVVKTSKKKRGVGEFDNLYRIDQKTKYNEFRQEVTIGYVKASNRFGYAHYKPSMNDKIVGLINGEIPIWKNKGFNQQRVGYIKLNEKSLLEEYYVEVTRSRGYWRFIQVALIVAALLIVLSKVNFENIHFSKDGLEFIKSTVTEVQEEQQMAISHLSDLEVKDGLVNIDLTSEVSEGLEFKVKIYIGDNIDTGLQICESERLAAGSSIDTVEISQQVAGALRQGTHEGILVCEIYNAGSKPVRTLTSSIKLIV